jgi:hypothetical protein
MYPYPNFSLPGGIPNPYSTTAQVVATASEAASALTGTFKIRPFAKEYLRIIKNPIYPLPPIKTLIDIREGQVFDDDGVQVKGGQGAYLRAKHEYFTSWGDATKCEIDELGSVSWSLSTSLATGMANWTTSVPGGSWKLDANFGIDMSTPQAITTSSLLSTTITANKDLVLESTFGNTDITTGFNFSHSTDGTYESTSSFNMSFSTDMNYSAEAGKMWEGKAGVQMNLNAPKVQIGSNPKEPMVMGVQLVTWLNTLVDTFVKNASCIGMGNMGAPVPLNPTVLTALQQLQTTVSGGVANEKASLITSKTITVSP